MLGLLRHDDEKGLVFVFCLGDFDLTMDGLWFLGGFTFYHGFYEKWNDQICAQFSFRQKRFVCRRYFFYLCK
jgi:hypothetical protein